MTFVKVYPSMSLSAEPHYLPVDEIQYLQPRGDWTQVTSPISTFYAPHPAEELARAIGLLEVKPAQKREVVKA